MSQTEPTTLGNPLPLARKMLIKAEEIGEASAEEKLEAEAIGLSLGAMQRQVLLHSATLALLSIAESLEAFLAQRDQ